MILVLGGTTEAREIAKSLQHHGCDLLLTTVSKYGGYLAAQEGVEEIRSQALSKPELIKLISERQIKIVLDVTHPYATQISEMAIQVCQKLNIPYIRYERPAFDLPEHDLLIRAKDYQDAAQKLKPLGNNVFCTIGSRNLKYFCQHPELAEKKIIARVLPEAEIIGQCRVLGLKPNQIIAWQGPFSKEANLCMFRHFQSQVVISKESGQIGGFMNKWEACLELGISLIVITRPKLAYPLVFQDQQEVIKHCLV